MPSTEHSAENYRRLKVGNLESSKRDHFRPEVVPFKRPLTARALGQGDSWAEKLLWRWLRDRRFCAYKFRREHVFGPYILDFFCVEARLDIELDGFQHGFPAQRRNDAQRDAWLNRQGIKALRFWNSRLRCEAQPIRDTIWWTLQARAPHRIPDYCRPLCQAKKETANHKK